MFCIRALVASVYCQPFSCCVSNTSLGEFALQIVLTAFSSGNSLTISPAKFTIKYCLRYSGTVHACSRPAQQRPFEHQTVFPQCCNVPPPPPPPSSQHSRRRLTGKRPLQMQLRTAQPYANSSSKMSSSSFWVAEGFDLKQVVLPFTQQPTTV